MKIKNSGITLIALVVTIVVLLILAGITIRLILNPNGIVGQAQDTKNQIEDLASTEINKLNDITSELNKDIENESEYISLDASITSTPAAEDGRYVIGETVTYNVTIKNIGNISLKDVIITSILTREDGTTSIPSGFESDEATYDFLNANESRTIIFSHVVEQADFGGKLDNSIQVSAIINNDSEQAVGARKTLTINTEELSNCSIDVVATIKDSNGRETTPKVDFSINVALYSDEAMTQRVGNVESINFKSTSSTGSTTFENLKKGAYYISVVDSDGNVIDNGIYGNNGVYEVEYSNGNKVIVSDNSKFNFNIKILI